MMRASPYSAAWNGHSSRGSYHSSLVNQRTESAPTNVRQPGQRIARAPVITEIHDQRTALHRTRVHEAPVAGVRGIVAIVAEDEILVRRHTQRTPGITRG